MFYPGIPQRVHKTDMIFFMLLFIDFPDGDNLQVSECPNLT